MQSCGGSITTSNAYFYISSGTDYSNFFTGGTKVSDFTDGERPGYYVFLLKSDNSSISLNAQTDGLHKFLGWKVVSGASNCSFTDASKASTTLKIKGKKVKAKINKKGVATFKLKKSITKKLKAGKKYKYTVTYGKDKVTKKVKVKR